MTAYRNHFIRLFVLLLAALAAMSTLAQPARGPGGPGDPGPAPLAMLLLDPDVHAALKLNTTQEALWTALHSTAEAARAERGTARAALQTLVNSQFTSGAPDLIAIEDAIAAEHEAQAVTGEALSAQAVGLFTNLDGSQQAAVIAAAKARYAQRPRR